MSVPGKLDLQNRAVGSSFPATLHMAARLLRALQRPLSYWVLSVVSRAPALPLSDLILHCPLLCSRISRHTDPPFPHTGQAHCPEHSSLLQICSDVRSVWPTPLTPQHCIPHSCLVFSKSLSSHKLFIMLCVDLIILFVLSPPTRIYSLKAVTFFSLHYCPWCLQ